MSQRNGMSSSKAKRTEKAVTAPVISPPRQTIFEDVPISFAAAAYSKVFYTIDEPHNFKIDPFNNNDGRAKHYKKPFKLPPGVHHIVAVAYSKTNHHAAPSPVVRRSFHVHKKESRDLPLPYAPQPNTAVEARKAPPLCEFVIFVDQSGSMRGLYCELIALYDVNAEQCKFT